MVILSLISKFFINEIESSTPSRHNEGIQFPARLYGITHQTFRGQIESLKSPNTPELITHNEVTLIILFVIIKSVKSLCFLKQVLEFKTYPSNS